MSTRRDAILSGLAAAFPTACQAATPLRPTPAMTEGPFYPDRLPSETDPDLVRVAGQVRDAGGEMLALGGHILDVHGTPIANSVVEIWQVDANGRYLHTDDARRGGSDPAFQGFGRVRADEQGRYAFRTIRPVPYPGRTPHIHFRIYRPNGRVLTTQLAVAGEPANDRDGLLRRLSSQERRLVTAELRRVGRDWAANWDVVLR